MAISKAFIVPHPPLIIPKVGLGQEAGIHKTFTSYHETAKEIEKQKPETIIIITPHGVTYSDYFHIASGDVIEGSMKEFGSSDVICVPCDVELSDKISSICEKADFPAGTLGNASNNMDHGTYVPLYFINQYYRDYKIVCISISGLPLREHYRLGMFINEAVNELGRNAIIIASGDLSHKLKEYGPYGYAKEGPALDRIMTEAMKTGNFLDFLEIDEELRKRGAECGLGSFTIMSGVLHKKSLDINFLSYEGPFGVGYAVCIYQVNEDDDNRDFLKEYDEIKNQRLQKIKEKEDEYVKLARYTLEHYILTRRLPSLPENLSLELLDRKAGVFVSIKKNGKLRGCIGTLEPSHDNVALEIMYNAVSAGTRDPRFAEVKKEELPDLLYSIDVLFLPEAVKNIEELDPMKYGIIVTSGHKRGVLLPELAEIETVEDQIKIACEKAGITEDEEYRLERFEVVRHI